MKNVSLLFMSLLFLFSFTSYAQESDEISNDTIDSTVERTYKDNEPYIFVERGVEFAVFPNGEFDFAYVGLNYEQNPYKKPNRPFSYNGGYNYDMFLQFDVFGAVIQIETVPVHYDNYGRIIKAGSVDISYSEDAVAQIGNMHVQYQKGIANHISKGYINLSDRQLVKQAHHSRYVGTAYYTIVSPFPYRENLDYTRYSFEQHKKLYDNSKKTASTYNNGRRTFLDPETTTPRGLILADNGGKYLTITKSDEGFKNISDLRTRNESIKKNEIAPRRNSTSSYTRNNSNQLSTRNSGSSVKQQQVKTNNSQAIQKKSSSSSSLQTKK